jgi:hypothetical protein
LYKNLVGGFLLTLFLSIFLSPPISRAELGEDAKIIFAHHSMGALLLGSRTWTAPREFSKPEDMQVCVCLDRLNQLNSTNVQLFHHDRGRWNSLRDCENNLVEDSWSDLVMGLDGNTPEHWQSLFVENRWPEVREKFLEYDVIVIKNSYQTVQDDHSPDYNENPDGAYTIVDKLSTWKMYLEELATYFRENHPDKILVHLGPAPRRGLENEGKGIHYPSQAVADSCRVFADWMETEWVTMAPNIRYFPFFDFLADENNVMDERWRWAGSHYEPWRGKQIGLIFAEYLYDVAAHQ